MADPSGAEPGTAVVLLSGGLDSGVALARHLERGGRVASCLFFDYGQPAARSERKASQALAARYDVPWTEVALPWLGAFARAAGSGLAPGSEPPLLTEPVGGSSGGELGDDDSAKAVWVPARNVVFTAIAASQAEALGADLVLVGFNREEAQTFPDNRPEFVEALNRVFALGLMHSCRVEAPVQDLDKPELARAAIGFGLGPDDFWSGYHDASHPDVGKCESSLRAERAWAIARRDS